MICLEVQIPNSVWMVIHCTIYQSTSLNGQSHQPIHWCLSQDRKKQQQTLQCFVMSIMSEQTDQQSISEVHACTLKNLPLDSFYAFKALMLFNHDCSQPRPSHCPVFDCLQFMQCAETGWWEGLGTRLDIVHFCNCNNTTYIIKFNFSVNYKDLNRTFNISVNHN